MFESFRKLRFNSKSKALLTKAQEIIEGYKKMNIRITLRQLYYQLVSRALIENKLKEYHRLSALLTNARYAGIVDWNAIEDRNRVPEYPSEWESIKDLMRSASYSYRLPRWENQTYYIELFTEKDALSSILAPIANKYHIHFCANRGYTSATAIYDLSKRIAVEMAKGKQIKVLYLGDFDPSGLDMVRDIPERLQELLEEGDTHHDFNNVEMIHIALTMPQIKKYKCPPNPAKKTDPRARKFMALHGESSWEVDALPPDAMIKLVNESIEEWIDNDLMQEILEKEKKDLLKLERTIKKMK